MGSIASSALTRGDGSMLWGGQAVPLASSAAEHAQGGALQLVLVTFRLRELRLGKSGEDLVDLGEEPIERRR
jgi:hypothetical protein